MNAAREDGTDSGVNLLENSYVAFSTMVQFSGSQSNESTTLVLLPILQKLEVTVNEPGQPGVYIPVTPQISSLQDAFASIVQTILMKIGPTVQPNMCQNIVAMVISIFKQHGSVTEAGLIILNGLASGCPHVLELGEIVQYLKHALDSKEGVSCRLSCGIISDLAYGKPETIANYLDDFVPSLMGLLPNAEIDRDIKVHSLRALGDLALNCTEKYSEKFLQWTTQCCNEAAKMSLTI